MKTYLITYGAENELATFKAENVEKAVDEFLDWAPVIDDDDANLHSINSILICTAVPFDVEAYKLKR